MLILFFEEYCIVFGRILILLLEKFIISKRIYQDMLLTGKVQNSFDSLFKGNIQ
jgi:hypothetical protein